MDAADVDKAEREIIAACAACGLTDEVAALRCLFEFALSVGVSRVEARSWQLFTGSRVRCVVVQFEFSVAASIEFPVAKLRAKIENGEYTAAMWKHTYGLMDSWLEDHLRARDHFVSHGMARLEELAQCAAFYAAVQPRNLF